MEQNQNSSLFGLSVDTSSKSHLAEAARWAKFLAIVGFIACGLIVLVGVFSGTLFKSLTKDSYGIQQDVGVNTALQVFMTFLYLMIALLYFFPCLFLYRFASNMKSALIADDQERLNSSFQNLKRCFRFLGILTIIVLAFYTIIIFGVLLGAR